MSEVVGWILVVVIQLLVGDGSGVTTHTEKFTMEKDCKAVANYYLTQKPPTAFRGRSLTITAKCIPITLRGRKP